MRSVRGLGMMLILCGALVAAVAPAQEKGAAPVPPPPEVVQKLHDVRPPVEFDPAWRTIDYVTLAAGAFVLLGLLIAALALRRQPPPEPEAPPPPPAHLEALAALADLGGRGYYEAGEPGHQAIAEALPPILKAYLVHAAALRAESLTSRETAEALRARDLEWLSRQLGVLLAACDRVKFGGASLFAEDPVSHAEAVIRAWGDRPPAAGGAQP